MAYEKMLTISAIKAIQIKATLKFHLTPVRITIIKTAPTTNGKQCGDFLKN
jgi:hypothetical protein